MTPYVLLNFSTVPSTHHEICPDVWAP